MQIQKRVRSSQAVPKKFKNFLNFEKMRPTLDSGIFSLPEVAHEKRPRRLAANSLRVTVLGCGTSTGTPIVGCCCKTCTSKNPRNERLRASVYVEVQGFKFLIDTSPDLRMQCLRNVIHHVDAVLYTHPHADHLHGFDELRTLNFLMGQKIPAFANAWTIKEISDKFGYAFDADGQEGGGKPKVDVYEIKKPVLFKGIPVVPLPVLHGRMPCLGYRIGNFAYVTDCTKIPDKSLKLMKNLDLLILDCLRDSPHPTHLTVPQALAYARRIQAKQTVFTHMSHDLEYSAFRKSLPKSIVPAYDGMKLSIESGLD